MTRLTVNPKATVHVVSHPCAMMGVMSLRVGIMLPSREYAVTGRQELARLVAFAVQAEEAGFDSVWAGDSLLARTRAEPLTLLAAVATATTQVTLGTAALIGPLRGPLLAAAQAATVDHVSRGRLTLGLGSGAPLPESRREFAAAAVPFSGRASRLDEMVRLWRHAWAGRGEFIGDHWRIDDLSGALQPFRPGGPPLWLAGGGTPAVLERVAHDYDGWLPYLPDPAVYAQAWQRIREQTDRDITPALYATVLITDDRLRGREQLDSYTRAYYRQSLDVISTLQAFRAGTARDCADWLGQYVQAGARHLILRVGSLDPHPGMLAEALVPSLRCLNTSH